MREKALVRLEVYFSRILRRPGLLKAFNDSAPWLEEFCLALSRCELIAELLAHHPSLVEGVATTSGGCPTSEIWENASERLMERVEGLEEGLEWTRRLKNERMLQLALCDLRGGVAYGTLERELTAVADFVVRHTYERVREHLHLPPDLPLAVLGLGKLGSREMSYLSDLDLVFVYEPRSDEASNQVPLDVIRLIQRLMRMLSTPLQEGPGYPVDARLRPTGNKGPLVVTRNSWLEYYEEQADIWEIQALLRVRSIAGSRELGGWIEVRALEICYTERRSESVWPRLCHLRKRMQEERSGERPNLVDLKLGFGGLTDIEFLVQGMLLLEGACWPALRRGSVREALIRLAEHPSSEDFCGGELLSAFEALRYLDHRLRLYANQNTGILDLSLFETLKSLGLWPPDDRNLGLENWEDLLRLRRRVRALLQAFCPGL